MTGGQIPHGADAVIVVEKTSRHGGKVEIYDTVKTGANIRWEGEIVRKGRVVIHRGTIISPKEIGVIATFNDSHVKVYRKPRVALFSTGDEIVPLGSKLSPEKIVDSNRHVIMAELKRLGLDITDLGIISDRKKSIWDALRKSARDADAVISIGGVSMGEFDFVRKGIEYLGRLIFWKVRMKPGGPLAFGTIRGKPVFGLPGNPVSSFLIFQLFVLPALRKMSGGFEAVTPGLPKQGRGKWHFSPVKFRSIHGRSKTNRISTHGSHDLLGWLDADGTEITNLDPSRNFSPLVFPRADGK
jgi:molybdopterin molybdotransferase